MTLQKVKSVDKATCTMAWTPAPNTDWQKGGKEGN